MKNYPNQKAESDNCFKFCLLRIGTLKNQDASIKIIIKF